MVPVHRAAAVISGRFHGLLFALQAGRPVIAVSSLPKTRRFLAEHGLSEWRVAENEPEALLELWPRFTAAWPGLAADAASIRSRLSAQTTVAAQQAREQLVPAMARTPVTRPRWRAALHRFVTLGGRL